MLRLLASKPACCAFARGANVRSSFVIPVWFFDQERMTMSDFDICKSIQSEWQLLEDGSDIEVYACLCTPRVSQLTMMVDWKSRGATDYAFRDGMFIHSTSMPEVKAIMFCTKTHQLIQPGQRCEHFCECRHMKTKFCLRWKVWKAVEDSTPSADNNTFNVELMHYALASVLVKHCMLLVNMTTTCNHLILHMNNAIRQLV